ncbi:MAG: prolyl oligopeptidase family serine peptidase [Gammaproteobacteria bacterium]|nr:prolyl oligopeptidase family serine peptidase [Gammaproteobacteria bacterium]
MEFPQPKQWELLSFVPILAGLYWLLGGEGTGWALWALLPGGLLLASGLALLLWPGDIRITNFMAVGGLLGVPFALFAAIPGTVGDALIAAALSAAGFIVAGRVAVAAEPPADGAPRPERSVALYAKAALDEALLAYFISAAKVPAGDDALKMCQSVDDLEDIFRAEGWLEDPARFHRAPPPPERVQAAVARLYSFDYQRLAFASGFEPDRRLPGGQAWAGFRNNGQAHAWLLRHPGPPRPWLLCIHGYRMGEPWMDFGLFRPGWLHHKLGLNLLMPVLPLHGPRRVGLRGGDGYLDYDLMNLLHAQTQALWDLRRALAWVRQQDGGDRVGVLGYSLGGYNTALLAQYEPKLDFVIAGIPVVDFAAALWRNIPPLHRRYFEVNGLDEGRYRRLLHVISPTAKPCVVPSASRYIFAGAADRVVLPEHSLALANHWQVPIEWYQGGHLTFRSERAVRAHIEAAMARAGWPVAAEAVPVT